MLNNKRCVVYFLEIIIALVITGLMIYKGTHSSQVNIDLARFASDYIEFSGDNWSVSSGSVNSDGDIVLLYGPYEQIKPGSYSVTLNYSADSKMTCRLFSAERGNFLHASDFYLSPNKHQVTYNFYSTQSIYDLEIRIVNYSGNETFEFNGASLQSTNHDMRTMLFGWVVICVLFNFFVFSKRFRNNRESILALLSISFIACLPIMFPGIAGGHDFPYHILRIEGIADGLKAGDFPVRLHAVFMEGFGYPNGIFYGDILLYIPAILRVIGFSINVSYKIYVFGVTLFTAWAAYYMGSKIFKSNRTALVVALVYVTASYRMVDIFVRSAVGEYSALAFYPIVAVAIWELYADDIGDRNYKKIAITLALGMLGLLYTHVLSTEMVVIVLTIVALSQWKKTFTKDILLCYLKAISIFIILGLAFIVPFLNYYLSVATEIKATNSSVKLIQNRGAYIADLFAVFRDFYGEGEDFVVNRMQITPGLVLMAVLVVALYLVIKKNATKEIKYLTISSLILLLISTNIFPWDKIAFASKVGNLFAQIQYPWRYIGIALVFLSILLGLVVERFIETDVCTERIFAIIVAAAMISIALFVGTAEDSAVNVKVYYDCAQLERGNSAIGYGEYLIENTDSTDLVYEAFCDNGNAFIVGESGISVDVAVSTDGAAEVQIPRYNYPYYKAVDDDGNTLNINNGINNRISISLKDSFDGTIHVKFVEPWYWRIAEIISLIGALVFIVIYIKGHLKGRKVETN